MPTPYSGQISYNDIRSEIDNGNPNFSLYSAAASAYPFSNFNQYNPLSFYQPTGGLNNVSPQDFYGYNGYYQTGWTANAPTPSSSNYSNLLTLDANPTVGSYGGTGTGVTNMGSYGTNGSLNNGMGWTSATGSGGGAWVLDGIDDFLSVSNGLALGTNFSVEVWFKVSGSFSTGSLAGQSTLNVDDWTNSNMWLLHPNATAGSTSVSFYVNENPFGSFRIRSVTTGTLSAGNWYQIVGTYSTSAGMKIYVNGSLINTTTGISGTGVTNNPSNTLVLGGDPRYSFRRLTGNISTSNIYNSALTATQVSQNFDARRTRYNL